MMILEGERKTYKFNYYYDFTILKIESIMHS